MAIGQIASLGLPSGSRAQQESVPVKRGLFSRFERWAWKLQQRGIERYLASSQDCLRARIPHSQSGSSGWSAVLAWLRSGITGDCVLCIHSTFFIALAH